MIEMKLNCNPLGIGKMYKSDNFTLYDGITILVGCNGAGKSTWMQMIIDNLKSNNVKCFSYNNLSNGGFNGMSEALFYGDMSQLATLATSSEGEAIIGNLGNNFAKIKTFIDSNNYNGDIALCIDGLDSGTSIDTIAEVKESMHSIIDLIKNDAHGNVYFIITSNTYELARKEKCYDVQNSSYIEFNDYEEFRSFILKSKHLKDLRNNRWKRNQQNRMAKEKDEAIRKAARAMEETENNERININNESINTHRRYRHSLIREE